MRGLYKRGNVWYGRWADIDGDVQRKKLSTDKRIAEQILAEERRRVELQRAGVLPANIGKREKRLAVIKEKYLEHLLAGGKAQNTLTSYQYAFKRLVEGAGWLYITDITPAELDKWIRNQQGLRSQTLNFYIGVIKEMLRWAQDNGMVDRNPLSSWRAMKKDTPEYRRDLTEQEVMRILSEEVDPERRCRWHVYFYTGLRLEAGHSLEWEWIDWKEQSLLLPAENNKSHKPLRIPLHPELLKALLEWRGKAPSGTGRVFRAISSKRVYTAFKRHCKHLGIDPAGVCVHSARHTVATMIYNQTGFNLEAVRQYLGHASIATTGRYLHSDEDTLRKAINTLDFGKAVSG